MTKRYFIFRFLENTNKLFLAQGVQLVDEDDAGRLLLRLLEQIADSRVEATILAVQVLEEGCDSLNLWVEQIQAGKLPSTDAAQARLEKRIRALHGSVADQQPEEIGIPGAAPPKPAAEEKQADAAPAGPAEEIRIPRKRAPADAGAGRGRRTEPKREIREIPDGPATAAEDAAPGAQIRVAADLMDKLVNYAGEVSIYRSRLEQQVGLVRHTLKDVDSTIQRLKEQLRKMVLLK